MLSVSPMNFPARRTAPLSLPPTNVGPISNRANVLPAPNLPPIFPQMHPYTVSYPPLSPTECTPRNVPIGIPMFGPAFGPHPQSAFVGAPGFPVLQAKGAPLNVVYRRPGDAAAAYYTYYPPTPGATPGSAPAQAVQAARAPVPTPAPTSAPAQAQANAGAQLLPMISSGHSSPTMQLAFIPETQRIPAYAGPGYFRSADAQAFPAQAPWVVPLATGGKPAHHPTHSCPPSLGSATPPSSAQPVRGFVEVKPFQRTHLKIKAKKLFRCDHCGKEYTRRHNMLVHKLSAHSDEKRFECHVCHSRFKRKSDYIRHNKEQHTNSVKRFVCAGELVDGTKWGCGKRFFRKDQLKKHLNANRAQYTCLKNVPNGKPASIDGITVTKASSSAAGHPAHAAEAQPAALTEVPLSA